MKNKLLLAAAAFWGLVFLLLLGYFLLALTGRVNMPFRFGISGPSDTVLLSEKEFLLDDLTGLCVKGRAEDIRVKLIPGDVVFVRQYGDPDRDPLFTDDRADGGSVLTVAVPTDTFERFFDFDWDWEGRLEIDLPSRYAGDLELSSISGNVDLGEGFEGGKLLLSSTSGDVFLGPSTVESLSVSTISGNLTLDDAAVAGAVDLNTTSGDVRAADIKAQSLRAESVSGTIETGATMLEDRASFGTTSGDVRIESLFCRSYEIESVSGEIAVENALSGGGTLHTASGGVSASGVAATGAIRVDSISGEINLSLTSGQNCDLKLSSVSGDIRSDVPLSYGGPMDNEASGMMGDGGPLVSVSTGSGDVAVNVEE